MPQSVMSKRLKLEVCKKRRHFFITDSLAAAKLKSFPVSFDFSLVLDGFCLSRFLLLFRKLIGYVIHEILKLIDTRLMPKVGTMDI